MNEIIFVVETEAAGGYTARALGAAIFTEADDLVTLYEKSPRCRPMSLG